MTAYDHIEETSRRLMRDLATFESELDKAKEPVQGEWAGGIQKKLEVSLDLIYSASSLLTSLINLKVKLNRVVEQEGAFQLSATKRALNTELTDIIQSVRTTLSSLTERNRTIRDIFQYENAKALQDARKVEG